MTLVDESIDSRVFRRVFSWSAIPLTQTQTLALHMDQQTTPLAACNYILPYFEARNKSTTPSSLEVIAQPCCQLLVYLRHSPYCSPYPVMHCNLLRFPRFVKFMSGVEGTSIGDEQEAWQRGYSVVLGR
jgi:hypothetical protein